MADPENDNHLTDVSGEDLMTIPTEFTGSLERPKSLSRTDLTGTEDIGADEIRLPRLAIAQGLSQEMIPGDARYIDGLKLFDFFNDLTKDVYGPGPITFVPVRRSTVRIEFTPREEGGGIVDMDVPPHDPRLKWTKDASGEKVPPKATTFTEFISLILRPGKKPEPIVISMKETNKFNRRAAKDLTTYIKLRNAAIYAGLYSVSSKPEKNDKGTFGTFVVKNAGFIPVDTAPGKALYDYAAQFAKSLEGKTIKVERDTSTADATADEFDAEKLERESAAAGGRAPSM